MCFKMQTFTLQLVSLMESSSLFCSCATKRSDDAMTKASLEANKIYYNKALDLKQGEFWNDHR